MELRIIIETRFINPLMGGSVQIDMKEYRMEDGNAAEIEYKKEREKADKSGGCMDVSISIVTKLKSK